jgi:very-short-patch-repair endonuclease
VDGDSHADRGHYDQHREAVIRSLGWNVVRVANDDIRNNLEGVLVMIARASGIDETVWLRVVSVSSRRDWNDAQTAC